MPRPSRPKPKSAKPAARRKSNRIKPKGIRLQKLMAERGYGSRRKMEGWIKEGRVQVDGKVATIGTAVTPENSILIDGKRLRSPVDNMEGRVLMYHKPEGEICSRDDPGKRPSVYKNLPKIRNARWVSVGRLDINTTGLLLFTTNGDLANQLMHPSSGIKREYRCRIYGEITKEDMHALLDGVEINGEVMKFEKILLDDGQEKRNRWVHVVIGEGRNREVRRLWEAVGCQVSRLTRVRYGSIILPRNLRQGKYRNLKPGEVQGLINSINDSDHAQ